MRKIKTVAPVYQFVHNVSMELVNKENVTAFQVIKGIIVIPIATQLNGVETANLSAHATMDPAIHSQEAASALLDGPETEGFYGEDCKEKCSCKSDELCHYVTGECEASVTTTTITSTDKTTFSSLNTNSDPTKSYILNKVKIDKNNVLSFKNNGKFETDINGLLSTTSVLGIMETEFPVAEDQDKLEISKMPTNDYGSVHQFTGPDRDEQSINTLMTRGPVQVTKSSKAKVNVKEVSATEASHPHEENYLNDEAHRGSINQPPINKNDLVNSASAATAISVAVIIIAVVIVATNHFIRNKKKIKEGAERTKGMPTVSVYTHSIFHTPL
ncbi:uncharacterized protein BDFB_006918, partial [Asbolus verrucosus]